MRDTPVFFGEDLKGVNGRIQTVIGPLARKDDGREKMGEGMHCRRIGEIICGYIHRLDRSDRAGIGVGDALLQRR